jgi:selenocysteine lyase/cysteine desulfurase
MIENQRHRFDIPDAVAYLNCAAEMPLLRTAVAAGKIGLNRKLHPWGSGRADTAAEAEQLRALFAGLIGATGDDIAIVPATSYGIAVAAANLSVARGQEILVLEKQFPSNYHAWRVLAAARGAALVTVPRPTDGDWTSAVLDHLGERTAIAALPHCHWTDGGWLDLEVLGARCREHGTALVVDATQHVGAAPLDIAAIDPDFLICSGYKWLLCPYTLAFLYAAPRHHQGRPLEHRDPANTSAARRFDMGERYNLINLPMAVAGLEQLAQWTPGAIAATMAPIIARIADGARQRGFAVPPEAHRSAHFIGLRAKTPPPDDLVPRCAADNVHIVIRGGAIRVSPYLFTRDDEIDRLFAALDRHHSGIT